MSATTNVGPVSSIDERLTTAECEALLRRVCFGHISFARGGHVDVLPIRYAFRDGWVYFRADDELSKVVAHSPWLVLSVIELRDTTRCASVVVRGGCYVTEGTGSATGDAAALRGILELRDPATVVAGRGSRNRRTSTVFRLHADEMRGLVAFVPRPRAEREHDAQESPRGRDVGREHTLAEDERADDDGMAGPSPPAPAPRDQQRNAR